ncbi:AAA family ATPase [uncultured Photobacterium sp.]|uniref:McrB family protein n=1 Tax=uncultured Photobacterium sp. TaxID=173973 RepID=UPI002613F5FE|nr:AAA family ATPase [uncultured Photobacterium sp.]
MSPNTLSSFVKKCSDIESGMSLTYGEISPSFIFSNTGKGGNPKYFSISLIQLIDVLTDIKQNLPVFLKHINYIEKDWRDLFSTYIKDPVVNALSTVQTLPLFALINKIIYQLNNLSNYKEKEIQLSDEYLAIAIDYLSSQKCNITEIRELKNSSGDNFHSTNIIYYGAPGTGKSYSISQGKDENYFTRTVFHPDTQYSDFIGCLKPIMNNNSVSYQFRPGPFTIAIIKAISDPSSEYFLVIEEINRAAAAAVFGEIFQLLDRDENGESSYSIDVSDPDLLAYLNEKTLNNFSTGKLKIPSNLSLLATMNSSDQAVMPMDTAFKRRWQFKYLQIDYSKASKGTLNIPIESAGNITIQPIEWSILAMVINKHLATERIPEDRLLGHRFISETELQKDPDNTLKGKLLMYLWDDVLRHNQKTIIFKDEVIINGQSVELINFSQLINAFEQGSTVFNNAIEESLLSKMAESVDTKTYLEYE